MEKWSNKLLICLTVCLAAVLVFAAGWGLGKSEIENEQIAATDIQNEHVQLISTAKEKNVSSSASTKFKSFPNEGSNEASIQRQFLQLDHETRMIIYYIQKGELNKINSEYGVNYQVNEEGKLIFEEMDIPELAISADLSEGTPLQLINGYLEGEYFSFHYYYTPEGSDRNSDLFVQYKLENNDWKLVNLRSNH